MTPFYALALALQQGLLTLFFLLAAALSALIAVRVFHRITLALVADAALLGLLLMDTFLLLWTHYAMWDNGTATAASEWAAALPVALQLLLAALVAAWCGYGFLREQTRRQTEIAPGSIREAVDNLPSGLCLANQEGRPVLTNRRMYALATAITGKNLVSARAFWEDLLAFADTDTVRRTDYAGAPAFVLADGSVWRFTQGVIEADGVAYTQITATDATRLWGMSQELELDNRALDHQQQRLQHLLQNIAEIRQAEELLSSKIRLHDQLGRAVLASRRHLLGGLSADSPQATVAMWKQIIGSLQANIFEAEEKTSAAAELTDIARQLGCAIVFEGDFPQSDSLLLAGVREALVNAVRHGGADRLVVRTRRQGGRVAVAITDNGKGAAPGAREGGGLSALRQRVEAAGGQMELDCRDHVTLRLTVLETEVTV